ncbi:hypothetical protein [Prevotella sp. 10(H)]|uniref:hypothetical protein n=1 Tax=Prevotella sp. 10(H) TaxID=1158294 RepID=UPI0004A75CE4|nr:hypothetical protein [Prevotella sp. 10(H)]
MAKSWLKKLIFEDDGTEEPEEPVNKTENIKTNNKVQKESPAPVATPAPSAPLSSSFSDIPKMEAIDPSLIYGKIDQELLNKLCEVLDKQTVEGIDYLKFKKSVDSLKEIQPDETVRFTVAYLTLKATYPSMTRENLSQTIDQYIVLMEQERKKGLDQLNNLRKQNVDKKEEEIKKSIANIDKMKAEIQKLTAFVTEANMEIVNKKNEYAIQEADFNATVDKIVNQLKGDKNKIETIIKTN